MVAVPVRSILVATDLSEGSDPLLRAAGAIAAATGAELHVLHALDFEPIELSPAGDDPPAGFPDLVSRTERALEEQVERAVPSGATVASRTVVIYLAHKAILARAADVSADLIVLGPHRGRTLDRVLGSTADRVVRTASVPVLVVSEGLSLPLRRTVAPIDLSEPARTALERAFSWTAALGHAAAGEPPPELHVLHVIPDLPGIAGIVPVDEPRIAADLDREASAARERAGGAANVEVVVELRRGGSPAEEILGYAQSVDADLLVLGTHGRGAIARALIGSVASSVARRATCAVLLVPPPVWREEG